MRQLLKAVPIALTFTVALMLGAGAARAADGQPKNYLVQLDGEPVVGYRGGTFGLVATKPTPGQKIDRKNPDVARYAKHLDERSAAVFAAAGGGQKLYDYRYALHGFAATLTPAQAEKLKSVPGVVSVQEDELRQVDTISTPGFVGLDGRHGLWNQVGGVGQAGEDVVIGMVDTGIWPESASFSGSGFDDTLGEFRPWHGACVTGEAFPASACNNKIIGARFYDRGFGGPTGVKATFPYEYNSARDTEGHGTHTSSTAAGNRGVTALYDGIDLGKLSGMAPRARLAVYKVCWGRSSDTVHKAGCSTIDSVAAIDDAVADGVDVINYSISGSRTSFLDPVEVAFLFAADAGVFVAASAGNSGPDASTVAHNSPWLTTVAAGTHDRFFAATASLGDANQYSGASLGSGTATLPVVLSTSAGLAGANPNQVRLCFLGTLDPAVVAGKIVVCDRGTNNRVDKSLAVKNAGGLGMILTNVSPNTLNADIHSVPTVHVSHLDRAPIRAYVAGAASPTAQISAFELTHTAVAPAVASFSSRGPALASGDILKPDVMAPGQDILAAVAPVNGGRDVEFYSGTSMSSPHVAGIGALIKSQHRDWSPAMIRSALVTTASRVDNTGAPIAGGFFAYGAGEVVPSFANDPGLVFDAGLMDYLGFICGTGQLAAAYCPSIAIKPANLNQPSIGVSALTGVRTVTRTVTNVSGETERYNCSASVPGFTTTVTPAAFTVKKNTKQALTIAFTRDTAPFLAYSQGLLTCAGDRGHSVTSPVALQPLVLDAPTEVAGTGAALSYAVKAGYAGAFSATAGGLVPATTFSDSVATGSYSLFAVDVPAGTTLARFSLFDETTTPGSDLDLYIFDAAFKQIGGSGGPTAAEQVDFKNLPAGTYYAYVDGFATAKPTSAFTLFTWAVGAGVGNMAVTAPATVSVGGTASVGLSFTGLLPATRYLGTVGYGGGAASAAATVVRVNTP
ncbi:MAG: S8 family serine peptidase [Comamonadaceae bacterium]